MGVASQLAGAAHAGFVAGTNTLRSLNNGDIGLSEFLSKTGVKP